MTSFTQEELATEEWRPIDGHTYYEVSSLGRIRSWRKRSVCVARRATPRIMSTYRPPRGRYPMIRIFRDDGKPTRRPVHALVAAAFFGPRPKGTEVRHFPDRDGNNNRISNLSYGTRKQNAEDRDAHGTTARGERHGRYIDGRTARLSARKSTETATTGGSYVATETV